MSAAPETATRPISLLIGALGGEGGGVLTSWIVNAARSAGLHVQATSIPGVAQRTGATTYYIELWPTPISEMPISETAGRLPVLSLSPAIGEVDLCAATELLETSRVISGGYVTPERTRLIASTHRVYTTHEKMPLGDGRYDPVTLARVAQERSRECLLLDLNGIAQRADAPVNAVLLGVISAWGGLPLGEETFREGIRAEGKAAGPNLRGFEAGLAAVATGGAGTEMEAKVEATPAATDHHRPGKTSSATALALQAQAAFPTAQFPALQDVLGHALPRLTDYQDVRYGALYLERLQAFRTMPPELLTEVARHLAVRMSYEDAIRVAQLKSSPARLVRIRAELGAAPGELVTVTDYFMPGFEEVCDILPEWLAQRLHNLAERRPGVAALRHAMSIRPTSIWGYARLRMLAAMRRWRRGTWRFRREQGTIEAWLGLIEAAAGRDTTLALEVAACARLIKGYGDTHHRGTANYQRIAEVLIHPALTGATAPAAAARAIATARGAALADPDGDALSKVLGPPPESGHEPRQAIA